MLQSSQMKMKSCRPQAAHNTFTDLTHVRQKEQPSGYNLGQKC